MSEIVLVRVVPAPVERVWELWTTAEGLRLWWWSHWSGIRFEVDAVPGGAYLIDAAAQGIGVSGTYLAVVPTSDLSFTWVWHDSDGEGAQERVDVTFADVDAGTLVTVHHSGPTVTGALAEGYRVGWSEVLDALAQRA